MGSAAEGGLQQTRLGSWSTATASTHTARIWIVAIRPHSGWQLQFLLYILINNPSAYILYTQGDFIVSWVFFFCVVCHIRKYVRSMVPYKEACTLPTHTSLFDLSLGYILLSHLHKPCTPVFLSFCSSAAKTRSGPPGRADGWLVPMVRWYITMWIY